jgi:hypothetical protein
MIEHELQITNFPGQVEHRLNDTLRL